MQKYFCGVAAVLCAAGVPLERRRFGEAV